MPFADYENFDACVADNQDVSNPEAYCAAIKRTSEGKGNMNDNYLKYNEDDREYHANKCKEKGWNHEGFEEGWARYSLGSGKSFFITDAISHTAVNMKGEKTYYVEGYISTSEVDRYNEVVTDQAMKEMLDQLKSGNIKLDIEHSTFTGENDIPIGKIVEAKLDDKGLWVKCILNKAHSKFAEVWKSIQEEFLDAFSIAYKVLDAVEEVIDGVTRTFLRSVDLLNVAITGNPVNPEATMTASFAKSMKAFVAMKSEEANNMSDEKPPEAAPAAEPQAPAAEPAKEPEAAPAEPAKEEPAKEPEAEPAKEPEAEPAPAEEPAAAEPAKEPEAEGPSPLDAIKSLEKSNAELKAEVKALKERLEKPVMKSIADQGMPRPSNQAEVRSPLESIK